MTFFTGAQAFTISNSQFINKSTNGPSGIDILLEAATTEAACDSGARADAPRCFPGTRELYIEDVVQWAIPAPDKSPLPLYWMNGEAGVGKSAIAQTSAEKIKESGILGASYFFPKNGTKDSSTFFPSIAYQLSVEFSDYRDIIDGVILGDKTLVNKTMEAQFRGLILNPLVELERQDKGIGKRIAIIVDGLDECEGTEAQCDIIEVIAESAREGIIPLCWAFFSRPEPHIESTFSHENIGVICQKIMLSSVPQNIIPGKKSLLPLSHDANGDIVLFLRKSFNNLLQSRNIAVETRWPSDRNLKMIMKAANGLFVYAATVYRFIALPDWASLDKPLQAVLAVIKTQKSSDPSSTPLSPFAELDAFYLFLLRRIPQQMLPSLRLLLAYLCLPEPVTGAMAIANLLGLSKADLHAHCSQLSVVLKFDQQGNSFEGYLDEKWDMNSPFHKMLHLEDRQIFRVTGYIMMQGSGGHIEFYDESFKDFLVDPQRSCEFCVKTSVAYGSLFENFQTLRLNHENTYEFQNSELVLAPGVPNSGSSLSYPYGDELFNSLMKTLVYISAWSHQNWLANQPELGLVWQKKLGMDDFRKALYIKAPIFFNSGVTATSIHDRLGLLRYIGGARLAQAGGSEQLSADEFSKLVTTLKNSIKKEQEAGIIQPYSPKRSISSRLFRKNLRGQVERGVYQIGHGPRAIFWFWEINYGKRCYREFRTANYVEGKKVFRAEQFDLWGKDC